MDVKTVAVCAGIGATVAAITLAATLRAGGSTGSAAIPPTQQESSFKALDADVTSEAGKRGSSSLPSPLRDMKRS